MSTALAVESRRSSIKGWLAENRAYVALSILVIIGVALVPDFATTGNVRAILYQYSVIGLLALGQLVVILTAGIDLSQGSVLALSSVMLGLLLPQIGLVGAAAVAVSAAGLCGLLSGTIVARTVVPPFIVTLAVMGIARGLALLAANARPVPILDEAVTNFGAAVILNVVPASTVVWVITAVVLAVILHTRRSGRYLYAVGGTEEGARLSGVPVRRTKLLAYVLSAACVGIAGVLYSALLGVGNPTGGSGYELEAIAAVVIGGGSLFGGRGKVGATVAGVLILGCISSLLNLSGVQPFWQGSIKGIVILLTVAVSQINFTGGKR